MKVDSLESQYCGKNPSLEETPDLKKVDLG